MNKLLITALLIAAAINANAKTIKTDAVIMCNDYYHLQSIIQAAREKDKSGLRAILNYTFEKQICAQLQKGYEYIVIQKGYEISLIKVYGVNKYTNALEEVQVFVNSRGLK